MKTSKLLIITLLAFILSINGNVASAMTKDLIAGQWYDVGDVVVTNDAENLYVDYIIDEGCEAEIVETHLHVALTEPEIPQNKKGNPQIGLFEYSGALSYIIPLASIPAVPLNTIVIAAHAVTGPSWDQIMAALPADPFDLEVINYSSSGKPYLDIVISNDTILDGPHVAWCADVFQDIDALEYYAYVVDFQQIPEINWLLNNYMDYMGETSAQGDPYVPGDVQAAIWLLGNGMPAYQRPDPDGYPDTNPWSKWAWGLSNWGDWVDHDGLNDDGINAVAPAPGLGHVDNYDEDEYNDDLARAGELASDAMLYGANYVPGCCEVIGLVLQPYIIIEDIEPYLEYHQPLIIEIPAACDETAWGDGIDGIPFAPTNDKNNKRSGSWAKYFEYEIQPVIPD